MTALLCLILLISLPCHSRTLANTSTIRRGVGVFIENDSRNVGGPGSDQAFTNGLLAAYLRSNLRGQHWAFPSKSLHESDPSGESWYVTSDSYQLGQQLYTPQTTQSFESIPSERPYAAWLYLGASFTFQKGEQLRSFELRVGQVGPSANGEQVQNNFHRLIGTRTANGWSHGLHDEMTVQLYAQQKSPLRNSPRWEFIFSYGGALGNVLQGLSAGVLARAGPQLPHDSGPWRPSTDSPLTMPFTEYKSAAVFADPYVFVGLRSQLTHRNIFLNGNSDGDSVSVKPRTFFLELEWGASVGFIGGTAVWSFVTRSPEHDQTTQTISFASLSYVHPIQ